MWKQPFLLSAGSRKPFNLLMCNCAGATGATRTQQAPGGGRGPCAFHILWLGPGATAAVGAADMFFSSNFWPTFNSGKRVKSKVVLSFREARAAKEKQKCTLT